MQQIQSNMDGRGLIELSGYEKASSRFCDAERWKLAAKARAGVAESAKAHSDSKRGVGPAFTLLRKADENQELQLDCDDIKGGTGLRKHWAPNSSEKYGGINLYSHIQEQSWPRKKDYKRMLWLQGWNDASGKSSASTYGELADLVKQLRQSLEMNDFICWSNTRTGGWLKPAHQHY